MALTPKQKQQAYRDRARGNGNGNADGNAPATVTRKSNAVTPEGAPVRYVTVEDFQSAVEALLRTIQGLMARIAELSRRRNRDACAMTTGSLSLRTEAHT